jgi:hypothetical protein
MTFFGYRDIDDYPIHINTFVAYTDGWVQTHPDWDEAEKEYQMGRIFQIRAYDEESGEMGVMEISDISGEWVDWRPNYAIPVQWEWNYRKYAAI